MTRTIVLAVDAPRGTAQHSAAPAMARSLCQDTGDRAVVLHVHEHSFGRFGRIKVCCLEGDGDSLVQQIVADFTQAGIRADGQIRSVQFGHAAQAILTEADNCDARLIVLGSSSRTDLPHVPIGSVSHRLLHIARRPVLLVPRTPAPADPTQEAAPASTPADPE